MFTYFIYLSVKHELNVQIALAAQQGYKTLTVACLKHKTIN